MMLEEIYPIVEDIYIHAKRRNKKMVDDLKDLFYSQIPETSERTELEGELDNLVNACVGYVSSLVPGLELIREQYLWDMEKRYLEIFAPAA